MIAHNLQIAKTVILTDKELKFIENYLLHGNATQAVLEAGYKTSSPGKYF